MKKGLKITLIVVVSVLVVLGAGTAIVFATQGDYVKNKFAMMTKDDKEYFQWVTDKNAEKTAEGLTKVKTAIANTDKYTSDVEVYLTMTKDFGSLFGLNNFTGIEKAGFKFGAVNEGKNKTEISLAPVYNGVDIIKLAALVDMDSKDMLLAVPSYKPDVIDLSQYFTLDLASALGPEKWETMKQTLGSFGLSDSELNTDMFSVIQQINNEINKAVEDNSTADSSSENTDGFRKIFYEYLSEVTLEKDQAISVNGLETECNVLNFKLDKDTIISMFKKWFSQVTDEAVKVDESAGDTFKKLAESIDGLLNSDRIKAFDISINCSVYVNKKGEFIGGLLKPVLGDTKLKIELLSSESEKSGEKNTEVELSFNGLKLGTVSVKTSEDSEGASICEFAVRPGTLLSAYLGNKKYALTCKTRMLSNDKGTASGAVISFVDETSGTNDLIKIEVSGKADFGVAEFSLDRSKNNVISADKLTESDYIDVKAIVQFLIDKLKEINDDGLNNFLSRSLANSFSGLGVSAENFDLIDTLQQLLDSGFLDMIGNSLLGGDSALTSDQSFNSSDASGIVIDDSDGILTTPDDDGETDNTEDGQLSADNQTVGTGLAPRQNENGDYIYSCYFLKDAVGSMEYKGVEVSASVAEVSLDEAKSMFLMDAEDWGSFFPGDENAVVEFGDSITFDAAAILGGIPLDDYSYTDQNAIIGYYQYGEGIDDQLLGMKVGDTKDINLTLDSNFGTFEGYNGDFRITVTGIDKHIVPEWTEEYIVGRLGYGSLEACEAYVAENYQNVAPNEDSLQYDAIARAVANMTGYELSDELLNRFREWMDAEYQSLYGTTFEEYFNEYILPYWSEGESATADSYLREFAFYYLPYAYIADAEGLTVTAEELEAGYASLAQDWEMSVEEVKDYQPEWMMVDNIIESKVRDLVFQYAIVE